MPSSPAHFCPSSQVYKLPGRDEQVTAIRNISMKVSNEIYPILRGEFVMLRGPSGGGESCADFAAWPVVSFEK
jgi:hypothetical protein